MDANILKTVIMFIILVSLQYTLNLILKELREMKLLLQRISLMDKDEKGDVKLD